MPDDLIRNRLSLTRNRTTAFSALETPALLPLPVQRYQIARFKSAKFNIDYHVEIDAHRYSVPHALVGQELDVRISRHTGEMLHRGQRVTIDWGNSIGMTTGTIVTRLLSANTHPEHGYRAGLGLLTLTKRLEPSTAMVQRDHPAFVRELDHLHE